MNKRYTYLPLTLACLSIFVLSGCQASPITTMPSSPPSSSSQPANPSSSPSIPTPTPPQPNAPKPAITEPISDALSRVTKKTFGLYVSPGHSPIRPERFTGYHTGVDFETTPAEQTVDVPIDAVCDGQLAVKEYANGYGGVAVQRCVINNQDVTVIYGHLRLSSIHPKVGDTLKAGEEIAVLGTGYSQETDGERKHLHLGIHKGKSINILGYVQKQSQLSDWIDAMTLLK